MENSILANTKDLRTFVLCGILGNLNYVLYYFKGKNSLCALFTFRKSATEYSACDTLAAQSVQTQVTRPSTIVHLAEWAYFYCWRETLLSTFFTVFAAEMPDALLQKEAVSA